MLQTDLKLCTALSPLWSKQEYGGGSSVDATVELAITIVRNLEDVPDLKADLWSCVNIIWSRVIGPHLRTQPRLADFHGDAAMKIEMMDLMVIQELETAMSERLQSPLPTRPSLRDLLDLQRDAVIA